MDKFAVIRIGGKQFRVSEGEEILVDKLKLTDSSKDEVNPEVLLVVDGDEIKVGTPIVIEAKVKIKIITELEKGTKIRVFKYKAKSRQRKHIGFRPQYTRLLIQKIS